MGVLERLRFWVEADHPVFLAGILLIVLGTAVFSSALRAVPTDIDDVLILSSVHNTPNPLVFFVQDIGLGKNEYRPLHAISVWVVERVVGINAAPHQLVNLLLHLVNTLLVLRLLSRLVRGPVMLFLLTAATLVSLYSVSPASWISDRPALLVGGVLLLLLDRAVRALEGDAPLGPLPVALLSLLAVLCKESGLIVPLVGLAAAFVLPLHRVRRWPVVAAAVGVMGAYMVFRVSLFGVHAASYAESGVILGFTRYSDRADLPGLLPLYALAENVFKNVVAVFLPVFDNKGGLFIGTPVVAWGSAVLATAFLGLAAFARPLTGVQRLALLLIAANAVIHLAVFRYRTMYLSEIAFVLFIAGAAATSVPAGRRLALAKGAAMVLLLANVVLASSQVDNGLERRARNLERTHFGTTDPRYIERVDSTVVERIHQRYRLRPEDGR